MAEVEAEHDVRVRRLTIAVDVGQVVNPDGGAQPDRGRRHPGGVRDLPLTRESILATIERA
ncbi:hypothetical protein [Nonomuraea polychroma]|uniref:hypothetical protein n=1 Tax=Nonomuraea polychroma TaxID=46176 RepID=UPI001F4E3B53|nr:hypothetical protein [Nonomuraea polychroma]